MYARLKCTKIRLAAKLRPDPLWELMRATRPPSRYKGKEGREGREERGTEREGGWNPPQSRCGSNTH